MATMYNTRGVDWNTAPRNGGSDRCSATGTTSSGGWRRGSRPADRRRRRGKDSLSVADAPGFSSGYKDQAQQSQLPGESEEFSVEDIMRSISKPPNNRYSNDEEKGISYGSKLNNDEDRSKPKSKPKSSSNSSDNRRSRGSRSTTSDLYGAGIIDEHLEEKGYKPLSRATSEEYRPKNGIHSSRYDPNDYSSAPVHVPTTLLSSKAAGRRGGEPDRRRRRIPLQDRADAV